MKESLLAKKIRSKFCHSLTSKVRYEIDHEDQLVENGRLSLTWYVDGKLSNWRAPNKVWGSVMFDSSTGQTRSFSMGFDSIKDCLDWIKDHPRVIDIYKEYVSNPKVIDNLRKGRQCQKREEIMMKYVKNYASLPSKMKLQYIIKGK